MPKKYPTREIVVTPKVIMREKAAMIKVAVSNGIINLQEIKDKYNEFAEGDYNTGNPNHTKDVNSAGKTAWQTPAVKDWWETSGKYWYKNGKGPK